MSNHSKYRIVANCSGTITYEYADKIEDAKEIAKTLGGFIQAFVFGIGWVNWCEAME